MSSITSVMFFQGLHPRLVTEGFDLAKKKALEVSQVMTVTILVFLLFQLIVFVHEDNND